MKGLLIKDLYMIGKYMRIFLLMIALFAVASPFSEQSKVFMLYCIVFIPMLGISLTSYDERFHWDSYCDAMPISRAAVVTERFLLTLAMVLLMLPVMCLIHRFQPVPLFGSLSLTVVVSLMLGLLCPSILYPVVFALGTEKGRIAYYGVIFGSMILAGVLVNLASQSSFHIAVPSGQLMVLAALLVFVIYAASWRLSVFFYKKRSL